MSKILLIIIIGVLTMVGTVAGMFYLSTHYRPVSEEEFEEFRQECGRRFDSLAADHDTIIHSLGRQSADIDSLKMGQEKIFNGQRVIYQELQSRSGDSHFWDSWFR